MWQLTSVWGALIPEVKCLLACKESYQIPDQRGPVGRYSPKVTEELVEVLGAVGGVVAAVKHQECGYRLLHKPLGVHCRPGGFRRPVRRPSVRPPLAFALALFVHANLARPPWEFRLPDRSPRFGLPGVHSFHPLTLL